MAITKDRTSEDGLAPDIRLGKMSRAIEDRYVKEARLHRGVQNARDRSTRLSRSLSGTNLERAGDFNQRTVLQAIRMRGVTTRVELAAQTGLTAPTIANITNRLIEDGLVENVGRTLGGRGQPALKLQANPDGAFGIGLNIDRDHLTLAALDLVGAVRARITIETAFAMPDTVVAFVRKNLPKLITKGGIDPSRVLGVGVAMPDDLGRIDLPMRPDGYAIWDEIDLEELFADVIAWPIHFDNDAAAATLGEAQYSTALDHPTFFYILISAGLGGGPMIERNYHRGTNGRSGEIGLMPDPTHGRKGGIVQDTVSLAALKQRLAEVGRPIAELSELLSDDSLVQKTVDRWLDDATRSLTGPLMSMTYILNPDAVHIGGRLPVPLIERLSERLRKAISDLGVPFQPNIIAAEMATDAPAIGAAMLPFLDHVLPSDSILIQAGRG